MQALRADEFSRCLPPAELPDLQAVRVAVVGLGYVGLPLARAFADVFPTVGFDTDMARVRELRAGFDRTRQMSAGELAGAPRLLLTHDSGERLLAETSVWLIAVPTPVDGHKRPDLDRLEQASACVGRLLRRGAVVIYESTVFPGATEERCIPILEAESGLRCNHDFYVGYSPERINPGDPSHRLQDIPRLTAGSTVAAADFVDRLYRRVVPAGTHPVGSIRAAEAAKVIENTQRDVNIALINEFAMLFAKLGLESREILEAAETKWNFLPFRPGLVGGHCVGVDPYYLAQKAQEIGYFPEMILAGRRINDRMADYVVESVTRLMARSRLQVVDSRILILGAASKSNCPDVRNSKVERLVAGFRDYHAGVYVHDPCADDDEMRARYGSMVVVPPLEGTYDAVLLAVPHERFLRQAPEAFRRLAGTKGILYDLARVLPRGFADAAL